MKVVKLEIRGPGRVLRSDALVVVLNFPIQTDHSLFGTLPVI
jgi:hypothetical protein